MLYFNFALDELNQSFMTPFNIKQNELYICAVMTVFQILKCDNLRLFSISYLCK